VDRFTRRPFDMYTDELKEKRAAGREVDKELGIRDVRGAK
jgi:hypothetical protein